MFSRIATAPDLTRLRWFKCGGSGEPYATDVEAWVHGLWQWLPGTDGGCVLVFSDDEDPDDIVGVSAVAPYEPGSTLWFISAIAVADEAQGRGLGTVVLQTTIQEAIDRQSGQPYGRCAWRVDALNHRMLAMCHAAGYADEVEISGGLMEFTVPIS